MIKYDSYKYYYKVTMRAPIYNIPININITISQDNCTYTNTGKYHVVNGAFHREDGPAIIYYNTSITPKYYLHGIECSKEDYYKKIALKEFW